MTEMDIITTAFGGMGIGGVAATLALKYFIKRDLEKIFQHIEDEDIHIPRKVDAVSTVECDARHKFTQAELLEIKKDWREDLARLHTRIDQGNQNIIALIKNGGK